MTIEATRANSGGGVADKDRIGVGMHVLAVDDNPTCLKLLETLLLKCDYKVTTTNQAIMALKLLRENRNKYDLVISDVNMPDMDGFKLLEHVGIEMDLPVIMLSAHGDKELVYEGVTHGAVDYLVKPVRIEELRNIWQHVIRRKKLCPKDDKGWLDGDKSLEAVGESGQGVVASDTAYNVAKANKKRKDQDEDDDEENGTDNEEPGNQKKARVVWSVELHRKFVAAVNQLGFDKAVPKKILDIMNVEGLTRENVASHLQKYRLYLKRISVGTTQQANMVAAYGGSKDLSYLRMSSLDGFGDFHTLGGSGRISNTSLASYGSGGMLGRLNTPSSLTLQGIANSSLLQAHSQTQRNSVNNPGKVHSSLLSGNQAPTLLQGIPSSLDSTQLSKSTPLIGDFNCNDDSSSITLASSFPDARVTLGSQANTMFNASGNPLMLQVTPQLNQSRGAFGTQSSLSVPYSNHQPFDVGLNSPNLLARARCKESWQNGTTSSKFTTSLQITEPYVHDQFQPNNTRDNVPSVGSLIGSSPISYSVSSALTVPSDSSRVDMQNQADLIGNAVKSINFSSRQRWEEPGQDNNSSLFGNINSQATGNGGVGLKYITGLSGHINSAPSSIYQHAEVERFALDPKMRSSEDYLLEQNLSQNGFVQNNYESLDDLMNAMTKRDPSEPMFMEGDFGFNAYAL